GVGVVQDEAAVRGVAGVEGEPEQPLLAAARDLGREVEEGRGRGRAAADDADPPGLLDDEQPPGRVAGRDPQVERLVEAARDDLEAGPLCPRRPDPPRGRRQRPPPLPRPPPAAPAPPSPTPA